MKLFFLTSVVIISILYELSSVFIIPQYFIFISEVLIFIFIIITFYYSYYKNRCWNNYETISYICFYIFICSRIIIDLFSFDLSKDNTNFGLITWSSDIVSRNDVVELLNIVFLFLVGMFCGSIFQDKKILSKYDFRYKLKNKYYGILLKFFSFIFLLLFLYKGYSYFLIITLYGYNSLFTGDSLYLPIYVSISDSLLLITIGVLMATDKKNILKYMILLFFISLIYLLIGMRWKFFALMLTIFALLNYLKGIKLKVSSLFLMGFLSIILSQFILLYRYGLQNGFSFGDIVSFFNEQGVSLLITELVLVHKDHFLNYYDGIQHLIAPVKIVYLKLIGTNLVNGGNTPEIIGSLSQKFASYMDYNSYINGGGYGSSSVTELYIAGGNFAVFLGGFLYIIIMNKIVIKCINSPMYIVAILLIIPRMLFSFRDSYFSFVIMFVFVLIMTRLIKTVTMLNEK